MTVSAQSGRAEYDGANTAGPFAIPFEFGSSSDIKVYVDGNLTAASITGGNGGTGSLTLPSILAIGQKLVIVDDPAVTQPINLGLSGKLPTDVVEAALDRITRLARRINDRVARTLVAGDGIASVPSTLEFADITPGNYLRWNLAGTGLESVAGPEPGGTFTQTGTGAVARSWSSKVGDDTLSITDFGAIRNQDSTAAINAALAEAASLSAPRSVFIPPGLPFLISGPINMLSGVTLFGNGRNSEIRLVDGASFTDNLIKMEGITTAVVRDFILYCNHPLSAGGTRYGIYIGGSSWCQVRNMLVSRASGVGIHCYNSDHINIRGNYSSVCQFHGIEVEQTRDSVISDNHCLLNVRNGIFVFEGEVGASGSKGVIIANNVMSANQDAGIIVQGPLNDGIVVANNVIRDNTETGLMIYDRPKNVVARGNIIHNNGHFGVYAWRTTGAIIEGNNVKGNSQALNNGYSEIFLEGDATQYSIKNIVRGNVVTINATGNKAAYHIKENSTNDGPNIIGDNVIEGSGVSGNIAVLHETGSKNSFSLCKGNLGTGTQETRETRGTRTLTSNGVATSYAIPHSLNPDGPRQVTVVAGSADAGGFTHVTFDAIDITVHYASAPPAGTDNLVWHWTAES